jgi:hypothetical protein
MGCSAIAIGGLLSLGWPTFAAEHGGQEHGGQEHAGQEHAGQAIQVEPSAEQIRQTIRDYIASVEQDEGAFTIEDDATGATRTLTLVGVHERVGKTGELYYSCTDMQDTATGELLDLDFDVDVGAGALEVVDVRIHKVNGQARYTYDEQDNRIPLLSTTGESTQGGERTY